MEETASDTNALVYLIMYISEPTLRMIPPLRKKDPMKMATTRSRVDTPLILATCEMNPIVFAPSVNAVKNEMKRRRIFRFRANDHTSGGFHLVIHRLRR